MYLSLYGSYQIHIIIAIDLEVYCYRGQGHLHNYNTSFINRDWYYNKILYLKSTMKEARGKLPCIS